MTDSNRIPPHCLASERSLLGSIMRASADGNAADAFLDAAQIIRADDFHGYGNRLLWECFGSLIESGRPLAPEIVGDAISKRGQVEDIGGIQAIIELWDGAPSSANIAHVAGIIREKAQLRGFARHAIDVGAAAHDPMSTPADVMAMADASLVAIQDRTVSQGCTIAEAVETSLWEWDRRSKLREGEVSGIPTPWPKLNWMTSGLQVGEVSVLAARPSVGKTLVMGNLIAFACDRGAKARFASLEQRRTELVDRWVAARAKVNGPKFRRGIFAPSEEREVAEATSSMSTTWCLELNDEAKQSATSIIAEARRMKRRRGLDLLAIDYLGLIDDEIGGRKPYEYLGDMVRRLKVAAKDLKFHVLLACQINRQSENRTDREPRLADLRDSGNIEEHADLVLMLHKPSPNEYADEDTLEMFVRKQRNGPIGKVTLVHVKRFFEVREMLPEVRQHSLEGVA